MTTYAKRSTLAALTLSIALPSCCPFAERHHRVTAEEFTRLSNTPPGSLHNAQLIGASGDRAYLEIWSGDSGLSQIHVYSAPLAELPEDIRKRLPSATERK